MRVMVIFDLPMESSSDQKEYRQFRKSLIKLGFIMVQKSVYCKLALNSTAANAIKEKVRLNRPPEGIVQMLTITETQYSKMDTVVGKIRSDTLDTEERLVIL